MSEKTYMASVTQDGINYPPPPWRLSAKTLIAASLVDVAEARQHIPEDLEIVEFGRGRTIGAIGIVDYGVGSIFPYNELVVICGIARAGARVGAWISHIWVDSTRSQAGGIELFGLAKQLASFTRIVKDDQVRYQIEAKEGLLLTASTPKTGWAPASPGLSFPFPARGAAFGTVNGDRRLLEFKSTARVRLTSARLVIPDQSPFAHLGLAKPTLTAFGRAMVEAGSRIQILNTGSLPVI
jgi:acetoacetate decarboxylase